MYAYLKMATLRTVSRRLAFFLVPRYPFANCLTLLMLLAERADRESTPFLDPRTIYAHLAIFVVTGVAMGFDIGRRRAAVVHAGQLLHLVFLLLTSERVGYRNWVKIRMASRLVGMSGMILLYAFFTMPKPRSHQLRRIGEIFFGIYLVALTYMLVESPEDRKAFVTHMPGGEITLYVYVIILATSALCYLPGLFVHDVTQACVILIFVSTILIDCDINYWVNRRGLDYWNHIRLLVDNVFIVISLIMYLSCTKKRLPEEEKVEEKQD